MRFGIIKREPSYFFDNIHEDLARFLKDTFGDTEPPANLKTAYERTFRPAIEMHENKKEYKIKVEMPGVKKEDMEVQLSENALQISGTSKYEKTHEEDNIKTSEFRYGTFSRSIPFENPVKLEDAKTEFKDGVLKIKLYKKEPDKSEEVKKLTVE